MAPHLPNPGFDANSFDGGGFDTSLPTPEITGVSNERVGSEWYTCDRCGVYYPRAKMVNQNGLNVCNGPGTKQCMDLPGSAVAYSDIDVPYEETPDPLPFTSEDL